MNYKKYTNNAYNLHLINTDKFKTIMVKINFKKKVKKEDTTYRNLLSKVLLFSTDEHKTKRDLEIAIEDLYNLSISATNYLSGNYIITSFNGFFLNEKYTEKNMNEKSFQFILDFILKPDIEDKKFNNFDLAYRLVEDEINTLKDHPRSYSNLRLLEEMAKNKSLSFNPIGYGEDLKEITSHELYKYYQKMLKSDLIDIFIIGDLQNDEIKNMIEKVFSINTVKKPSEDHFIKHDKVRKRAKIIKEQMPLEQAKLVVGFKTDNLTEFEKKYVMSTYSFILGGGPDSKLFKNIREKHSLCYYISCTYRPVSNILMIDAGINNTQFKKCLSLIKKEIIKLNKGEFQDTDLEAAKITYINSLKEIEDSPNNIITTFESHEYLNFDLLDERMDNILNVTKDDVLKVGKKIHLDTVYLLEGGNHEEK